MIAPPPLSPGHHIARTPADLEAMVREMRSVPERAVDFETTGLRWANGDHPIGFAVGHLHGRPRAWYVPVAHRVAEPQVSETTAKAAFRDALEGAEAIIGHNLKFDLNMARKNGWEVPLQAPLHDSIVQAHLLYAQRPLSAYKLESLASSMGATYWSDASEMTGQVEAFLRSRAKVYKLPWKRKTGRECYLDRFGHSEVPIGMEGEYACRDVIHALLCDWHQRSAAMGIGTEFEAQRRYLYNNEMLLVRAIADMEYRGQLVDRDYLRRLGQELDDTLERMSHELDGLFGLHITWSNDNELRDLLYNHLGLPIVKRTEHDIPSVDRSALLQLRPFHSGMEALAEYNAHLKVRTTYTDSLAWEVCDDGRIHASFVQIGTDSSRFSGKNPNLQNVPSPYKHKDLSNRVRRAFFLPPGMARAYGDYSQIELRVLAHATGCQNLLNSYWSASWLAFMRGEVDYVGYREMRKDERKIDVHGDQARNVFGVRPEDEEWSRMRRAAKIINFGVAYGMGWYGLNQNPELLLPKETAKHYLAQYHRSNPEIGIAKDRLWRAMLRRQRPYFVNWAGRIHYGDGLRSAADDRVRAEKRRLFALLIQGSAGELTRFSLVRLWRAAQEGRIPAVATSTVHDEIQLDCRQSDLPYVCSEVQRIMEDFHGHFGGVPVVCDMETSTTTWAEKKEYLV